MGYIWLLLISLFSDCLLLWSCMLHSNVPTCKCWDQNPCMSSIFSVDSMNQTYYFLLCNIFPALAWFIDHKLVIINSLISFYSVMYWGKTHHGIRFSDCELFLTQAISTELFKLLWWAPSSKSLHKYIGYISTSNKLIRKALKRTNIK